MNKHVQISDFDFDAIYRGLEAAHNSHLTLVVGRDGSWACEPSDTRLENQLCRITERYSRSGLEARIRADIEAANAYADQIW